jgi:hypothetical protein
MKNLNSEEENPASGCAPETGDMPADDFRRFGRQVVDWIADYFERMEDLPVLAPVEPGWLRTISRPKLPWRAKISERFFPMSKN